MERCLRQRPLNLFTLKDLDDVLRADVIVVFERHAAFLTRLHLGHFVLEALQRLQRAFVDHHIVAQQAHTRGPARDAFGDQTARNLADAGTLKTSLICRIADEVLTDFGAEQTTAAALTSSTRS